MASGAHHIIILGCGRSGTSIFGEYFEHLPEYQYLSEPPFDKLRNFDFSSPVAIKVPRDSIQTSSTPGLSFPLEEALQIIPEPITFFWQVRHPLDTICSLKVGISRNWGHHPKPPDWKDWTDKPLVMQCAHHWNYINTLGFEAVAHLSVISRFEDMIAHTEKFLHETNQHANISVNGNKKAIEGWRERVQNTNNSKFREAATSRPYSTNDHSVRINRWKENLSSEEIQSILPIISETASKFRYQLPQF